MDYCVLGETAGVLAIASGLPTSPTTLRGEIAKTGGIKHIRHTRHYDMWGHEILAKGRAHIRRTRTPNRVATISTTSLSKENARGTAAACQAPHSQAK